MFYILYLTMEKMRKQSIKPGEKNLGWVLFLRIIFYNGVKYI